MNPNAPLPMPDERKRAAHRKRAISRLTLVLALGVLSWLTGWAQGGRGFRSFRTPNRDEYPRWDLKPGFERDVFTFIKIRYPPFDYGRWRNDYPDGDLNFSYRLQQMTSLRVDPNGRVLDFTSPELFDYPFIYVIGPGRWNFTDEEAQTLRRYLLNGGFLMVDDLWAREPLQNLLEQMKKVFPERDVQELQLDHPIFQMVFPLKEKPQVTDIQTWRAGYSYEWRHGDMTDPDPHFLGFFDDRGRLMALLCHNNDLGDGWEREGENPEYFHKYSERFSFPMGINVLIYAMTH